MHEKAAHTYQRAQHKNAKANQKHILIEHEQKKKRQSDMCVVYRLHSFDFLCASFIFAWCFSFCVFGLTYTYQNWHWQLNHSRQKVIEAIRKNSYEVCGIRRHGMPYQRGTSKMPENEWLEQ